MKLDLSGKVMTDEQYLRTLPLGSFILHLDVDRECPLSDLIGAAAPLVQLFDHEALLSAPQGMAEHFRYCCFPLESDTAAKDIDRMRNGYGLIPDIRALLTMCKSLALFAKHCKLGEQWHDENGRTHFMTICSGSVNMSSHDLDWPAHFCFGGVMID